MKNDRAKSMFQAANAYAKAAELLNKASQEDVSILLPSQVNAALALELYFKSLYYLEYGEDFKVNGKHSHDFHELSKKLSNTTQCELQSEFQQIMQSRNMQDVRTHEAISQIKYMMFFPEIEQVLLNAIQKHSLELKP